MKIKICGLFREEDIEYINEARPDYSGFVFAESRRQISPAFASRLRKRLADGIIPVGVFVDAAIDDIAALYRDGIISIAQLHGNEDEVYTAKLKEESAKGGREPVQIIKTINLSQRHRGTELFSAESISFNENSRIIEGKEGYEPLSSNAQPSVSLCLRERYSEDKHIDYYLLDSGAGSGKTFNWDIINQYSFGKPWFLAGGIDLDNIEKAMALNPFAVDVSSGAETDGVKDRRKILHLTAAARKGNVQ